VPKKSSRQPDKAVWKGFVPCELNSKRKEQFREWSPNVEAVEDYIERFVAPGYKLSFSIDTYHDCVQVSYSCSSIGDPNCGWTLTARGNDLLKALAVLLFKHVVILECQWDQGLPADEFVDDIG